MERKNSQVTSLCNAIWYFIKLEDFGHKARLVASMKKGIDALTALRYKLRMMGIITKGPSFIYLDNMSVMHNASRSDSVLRKKCNSVCYHAVHESVLCRDLNIRVCS